MSIRSAHANPSRDSVMGFGPISAIVTFLSGEFSFSIDTLHAGGELTFYSSSKSGGQRTMQRAVINHPSISIHVRSWTDTKGQTGPYLAALIEACVNPHILPEIKDRIDALIAHLHKKDIDLPTRSEIDWHSINNDDTALQHIMSLSDSLYFETKMMGEKEALDFTGEHYPHHKTPVQLRPMPHTEFGLTNSEATPPTAAPAAMNLTTPLARLERLTRTGGTALLTGPTGVMKTETAKRTAVNTNSRMIILKGAAGIEDRDFWGSITPTETTPKWVDGPLTKAFRSAQTNPTVLIIDELLRFEPLYANVLIGALDTVTSDELNSMGISTETEGSRYLVTLPTGETLTAPTKNLTIIATTNLGDDYAQFTQLDSALLGRFELQIDITKADTSILKSLYAPYLPNTPSVQTLIAFEQWTTKNTGVHGGLLQRATNPRVTLNLLKEAQRLHQQESTPLHEALEYALEVTIIPYCSPRDTSGALTEDAGAVLRDEFRDVTRVTRIAQAQA